MTLAKAYMQLGETAKAEKILDAIANKSVEYITWYLNLNDNRLRENLEECMYHLYLLDETNKSLATGQSKSGMAEHYSKKFNELYTLYKTRVTEE